MRAELPGSAGVVEDWPGMLRRAGLTQIGGFTLLLDLPAPVDESARTFLHARLTRIRETMSESWMRRTARPSTCCSTRTRRAAS
ncbi:hypothetical protein [Streptomyces sp. NPDC001415]